MKKVLFFGVVESIRAIEFNPLAFLIVVFDNASLGRALIKGSDFWPLSIIGQEGLEETKSGN